MSIPTPIAWTSDNGIRLLDQTLLPQEERYLELHDAVAVAEAIRTLRVRGAPLIGIAAAMAVAADGQAGPVSGKRVVAGGQVALERVRAAVAVLGATRPTAVNLQWALRRMERRAERAAAAGEDVPTALRAEADAIWEEDRAMCDRIGVAGAELIGDDALVLTHCNAGALEIGRANV